MFRIGQKVVCVKGKQWKHTRGPGIGPFRHPESGQVYTVYGIDTVDGREWLRIAECDPDFNCYIKDQFRPVVEKKTDIGVFEEILRRESIDAPERVS